MRIIIQESTKATPEFLSQLHRIILSGDWPSMDHILDELSYSKYSRKIMDVLKKRMDLAKFGM